MPGSEVAQKAKETEFQGKMWGSSETKDNGENYLMHFLVHIHIWNKTGTNQNWIQIQIHSV